MGRETKFRIAIVVVAVFFLFLFGLFSIVFFIEEDYCDYNGFRIPRKMCNDVSNLKFNEVNTPVIGNERAKGFSIYEPRVYFTCNENKCVEITQK